MRGDFSGMGKEFLNLLMKHPFQVGKVWTTDAIYRETRGKVKGGQR